MTYYCILQSILTFDLYQQHREAVGLRHDLREEQASQGYPDGISILRLSEGLHDYNP